jgi:NADH:ubiquinone reductase (H+-translocating)
MHRVVIAGGGFAGLYAARALSKDVHLTLIDRRNFHLFQPLLYQVATGGLSPGDIASPLRAILKRNPNAHVITAEIVGFDPAGRKVILADGEVAYDTLIVATGVTHDYFGRTDWAELAPGLKTIEDATEMRRRILLAFESAERESDPDVRRSWLTFAVVGAGPTGVELAGAIAELANTTMKDDFRSIDPRDARIVLFEGADRILPPFVPSLSERAGRSLRRLNVEVLTGARVTHIDGDEVVYTKDGDEHSLEARTVLWAAGVKASPLGKVLADGTGVPLDRVGRVVVQPDLTLPGHPEIFVLGDLASVMATDGKPVPGVAPAAMQMGRYTARVIQNRLNGKETGSFRYMNKGNLAVIGRNAAVADLGFARFGGFMAWLVWIFIHIMYLVGFDNKVLVFFQWGSNYFTRKRGARLITGEDLMPNVTSSKRKPIHDYSNQES